MDSITYKDIRTSLIEYYSKQDEFKDFNWTAPAISTLIDAQAYLAYYLNTYANFALNESFLDTAIKRSSVVSKARNIGYFPAQYTASTCTLQLTYTGSADLSNHTIPAGAVFSAKTEDTIYYFRTYKPALIQKTAAGRYWAQVLVREGIEVTNTWTQNSDLSTRFILSDPRVDTSTITVRVYDSTSDSIGTLYTRFTDILQFGPNATGYTIEENTDGNIELIFGDGVLSKLITAGQIVTCSFLVCSGAAANNISTFQLVSFPDTSLGAPYWEITSVAAPSSGGADRETIESIKLNAPRFFQRQGRNVTADDYKADLLNEYSSLIEGISVWGGENNNPPAYGNVMVAIKPDNALSLSSLQKENICKYLENSSVVGITVNVVDPIVLYVNMDLSVTYNKLYLKMQTDTFIDTIKATVKSYFNDSISSFNCVFKYSKFLSSLFAISDTISDIDVSLKLSQWFEPSVGLKTTYNIDFQNAIEPGSVIIGPFYDFSISSDSIYMTDLNSNGILYQKTITDVTEVGSVDYTTGVITIDGYAFGTQVGEQVQATCVPANNNMKVTRNYVFTIETLDVELTQEESVYTSNIKE